MNSLWLGLGSILLLTAVGAYFWLQQAPPQLPPPPVPAPAISPPAALVPPEPGIMHPMQAPPGVTERPSLEQADDFVKERLTELLGAKAVKTYLLIENV